MKKNKRYSIAEKVLRIKDMAVPDEMTIYNAFINGIFTIDDPDAVVSAVSLRGVSYEMNLSASIIFESIIAGEDIQLIVKKFREIFTNLSSVELENEIAKTIETFEESGFIKSES